MENKRTRVVWLWFRDVILPCLVLYILFFHIIGFVIVAGSSMEPTYSDGSFVFINRLKRDNLNRGDVVVIDDDISSDEKRIIKRVIGMPGDVIDITASGVVLINGEALDEPYIVGETSPGEKLTYPLLIPDDYIFVMGDNREHSNDSRGDIGLISIFNVLGVVLK